MELALASGSGNMDTAKECKSGWLAVESDFSARLEKPELLKYGEDRWTRHRYSGF